MASIQASSLTRHAAAVFLHRLRALGQPITNCANTSGPAPREGWWFRGSPVPSGRGPVALLTGVHTAALSRVPSPRVLRI